MAERFVKLEWRYLDNVASVFREVAVRQINFTIAGLPIHGPELAAIGKLISQGEIKCYRGPTSRNRVAEYHSSYNTMVLSNSINVSNLSMYGSSCVLHEGVHALIDKRKLGNTYRAQGEAAAYIVEAIYYRLNKRTYPKEHSEPIINEAIQLASHFRIETGSIWLSLKDITPLMLKVQAHYRTKSDPYDLKDKVLADG